MRRSGTLVIVTVLESVYFGSILCQVKPKYIQKWHLWLPNLMLSTKKIV